MVTITHLELLEAFGGLTSLSQIKLPPRLAILVVRALRETKTAVEEVEQVRNSLIQQYAEVDEDGNIIQTEDHGIRLKDDTAKEFAEAWKELLDGTVPLQHTIPESAFETAPELEPAVLLALGPLLTAE